MKSMFTFVKKKDKMTFYRIIGIMLVFFLACHPKPPQQDAKVWEKVHLNFRALDADGLMGPAKGKVAMHYEFCIPKNEKMWEKVQKIDPTAQRQTSSKGRIACRTDQWLILGVTHQKQYLRVLYDLANLPFVATIEETVFE